MVNKVLRLSAFAFAFSCAFNNTAFAFDGSETFQSSGAFNTSSAGCFDIGNEHDGNTMAVFYGEGAAFANGSYYDSGNTSNNLDRFTEELLVECVANYEPNSLRQWGGDDPYASETSYGIGYKTTDGALHTHHYSVAGVDAAAEYENSGSTAPTNSSASITANSMIARAHALAANQGDLYEFLRGGQGSVSGGGNGDNGSLDFVSNPNNPIWLNVKSSWSKQGDSKTQTIFGEAGAHYKFNPNLLVGLMVQLDRNVTKQNDAKTESTGWMVGPYVVAKLPDQPLYFEARALYGQTANELTIAGATDKYSTERYLLKAKITGELDYDSYKLLPNVSALYIRDNQESYTSSNGTAIGSQSITYSEITAGLDVVVPIMLDMGKVDLKAGFDAIYSRATANALTSSELDGWNDFHGRVDLGFDYAISSSSLLSFNTYYDGIGASDQETLGLEIGLAVKF